MMGRRGKQPEGPRASFKQLLPFIFEHKRVLAVVAGHMHHRLKGGGERKWLVESDGVLYVNAARVPRIEKSGQRYHVCLETDGERARAELVAVSP